MVVVGIWSGVTGEWWRRREIKLSKTVVEGLSGLQMVAWA